MLSISRLNICYETGADSEYVPCVPERSQSFLFFFQPVAGIQKVEAVHKTNKFNQIVSVDALSGLPILTPITLRAIPVPLPFQDPKQGVRSIVITYNRPASAAWSHRVQSLDSVVFFFFYSCCPRTVQQPSHGQREQNGRRGQNGADRAVKTMTFDFS